MLETIIEAFLEFFFKRFQSEAETEVTDHRIEKAGDKAVATKDTSDLENSLS